MEKISGKNLTILMLLVLVVSLTGYLAVRPSPSKGPGRGDPSAEIKPSSPGEQKAAPATASPRAEGNTSPLSAADALHDPDPAARIQAAALLRNQHTLEAVRLLEQFLADSDPDVLSEAMDSLGNIGLNGGLGEQVFAILQEKVKDPSFARRDQALLSAAMIGKGRALPLISDFLSSENGKDSELARNIASRALNLIADPSCVPQLKSLMEESKDPGVKRNSIDALARIGTPEAISLITKNISSSDPGDQAASVAALARLARPEFNQMLAEAVQNGTLQKSALQALAASPAAPQVFSSLLADESLSRDKKISVMKEIGSGPLSGEQEVRTQIASSLRPFLDSPDTDLQLEAIRTLGQVGGKETGEFLLPKLYSEEPQVRQEALNSFIGYVSPNNYQVLFDLLWDNDEKTRRTAMFFVSRFVNNSDVDVLQRAAGHEDQYIQEHATKLLSQLRQ